MSFNLRFAPEAEESYDAILLQLRERWGTRFVEKLETTVQKSLQNVINNPFMYPILEETTGMRKCILHKNCSMLYNIHDDFVIVICFWDNRQDPLVQL